MPDIDLFNFFRLWLAWIVTIYASILTAQSLYGWYIWLAGQDKYIGILRRYLIVHGLRLRFKTFWGDVIITVLLTVVFLIMWKAHHDLYDLKDRVADGYRQQQQVVLLERKVQETADDGAQHP
jgi:hypothetical protein